MKSIHKLSRLNKGLFTANIPGSKSFTNRALVIAAHRVGETLISNALICDDTLYLAKALDAFDGISVVQHGNSFHVNRTKEQITAPSEPIFLGAAGTPVRLMLAFSATAQGETLVTGNARLSERPMQDILDAFDTAGIHYEYRGVHGCLPVLVKGGQATTTDWTVSGEISSQFLTSLLIHASQQSNHESIHITVPGHLVSKPYVLMTLDMMAKCGLDAKEVGNNQFVVKPSKPTANEIKVEVDASGMSYFLTAAALTKTTVRIPGITLRSAQGDVGLAKVYASMGCTLIEEADAIVLTGASLKGIDVDMEEMPDVVLSLAMAASQASSPTHITNIANLRVKECDRIAACSSELQRLGGKTEEGSDWLTIYPVQQYQAANIHTYDDHRVAMAFSLIGLISDGVAIEDPECVSKSFPNYWQELERFIAFHTANQETLETA